MATGRIGVTPTLGTRWSKAPAGGTTSLSGLDDNSVSLVYSVGYEQVYRNGVLLSRGNDYTATTGNSITLIDATIAGDIIEVFANELVPLTDAISKGQFTAKGALLSATAASTPGVLAVGTNGQYLQADSTASTGLKWADVSAGGMTLISETVASSLTSLTLGSIPGTYKQLLLIWSGINHSNSTTGFALRINNSSNASDYPQQQLRFANNTPSFLITTTSVVGFASYQTFGEGVNLAGDNEFDSTGYVLIDNYSSTTKKKYFDYHYSYYNNSIGTNNLIIGNGCFQQTSAITSLDIYRTNGTGSFSNRTNTTIRLYGVA